MHIIKTIDFSLMNWVQEHFRTKMMDRVMLFSSRLGDGGLIWIIYALLFALSREKRDVALALTLCVTVCALVGNFAIKPLFKRTRPCNRDNERPLLLARPEDSSFPSCHTMTSFAATVMVWQAGGVLGLTSFVFASLISYSRIYLYVHYPSDVLIGAALGLATGKLFLIS